MIKKKFFQAIFFLLFAFTTANSQNDAHYWTHQYGAKGLLMNGAVIAAPDDAAAIFYNPGAIGNGEDFGLSLSFYSPSYTTLRLEGYLGSNNDLEQTNLQFLPGFGALSVKLKNSRWRAAFASFTRLRTNIGFRSREISTLSNDPSKIFVGNLEFYKRLTQRWFGVGFAYKVSDNLSLGITQFGTNHSETAFLNVQKEISSVLNPSLQTMSWRSKTKFNYRYDLGFITKFGLTSKMGNIHVGLVVTTPTYLFLFKKARYDYDDYKYTEGQAPTVISDLRESPLENPSTPLSIGFGVDFPIGSSTISMSSEYFFPVPVKEILGGINDPFEEVAAFPFQIPFYVKSGNTSVFNFAIGVQRKVSENTTLIGGFRTDFNQRELDPSLQSIDFLSSSPSIFHISAGGFFTVWKTKFSLGFDYGYGRKSSNVGLIDLGNIDPEFFFQFGNNGNVTSTYRSFTMIFTYDFIIKKWNEKGKGFFQ